MDGVVVRSEVRGVPVQRGFLFAGQPSMWRCITNIISAVDICVSELLKYFTC